MTGDFVDGDCRVIAVEGREIGIFRLGDEFYAYYNHCVHQGGPVCQGKIIHKVEEVLTEDQASRGMKYSEQHIHIVCPWHGYEYDIRTGLHPGDPSVRLKQVGIEVRRGEVYVRI